MSHVRLPGGFNLIALLLAVIAGHCAASDELQAGNLILTELTSREYTVVRPALKNLYEKYYSRTSARMPFGISGSVIGAEDYVVVDAIARGDADQLLQEMELLGLRNSEVFGRFVSGELPLDVVPRLDALESINEIRLNRMQRMSGGVTSQGDRALRADRVRDKYSIDGSNVTVGVISDSYNCLGGEQADKLSGDLPDDAYAVEETLDCTNATDEGRALMQVIHDIAPGAGLVFHTGNNGVASVANGILELAIEAGANVIVDDVKSLGAPFFQDDLISQAVRQVAQLGVTYVTAAGNSARLSYEAAYDESINPVLNTSVHDFDPGPDVDAYQQFFLEEGGFIELVLQWDSPSFSLNGPPGAHTDLDIFITDEATTKILASSTFGNAGKDPVEVLSFFNPVESGQTLFNIVIAKVAGPSPKLVKYVLLGRFAGELLEFSTESGTIFGHANSDFALTVGAADYRQTPEFGVAPPVLESFSSAGGTRILFDAAGNQLDTPIVRAKPDVVAPDNVNTTFFEGDDSDNDGFPNFLGTSAAAPHAAAVAALILDVNSALRPEDVGTILRSSAIDIVERNGSVYMDIGTGSDFDSGFGLIDAEAAVGIAQGFEPSPPPDVPDEPVDEFMLNGIRRGGGAGLYDSTMLLLLVSVICWRIAVRHPAHRFYACLSVCRATSSWAIPRQ